ncbi:MFS general substrate transporter [Lepidopterella palustris CBS 459.81]|uniref:MFS general substrate transporter n=1 Tax=Lepidopterella palustris CBS 459.81 TaxID=1314670 RepID=A0A8E2EI92_9PEZI|nr:MFS general substrate transporter [Lepidopterella palustris CBS 459.81]
MAAIVSSTFLYALDGTIVAVLQPGLIKEFGHIKDLSWLSVAFLLCATATNLAWGRVYSNFNAKWLYIFYIFIFEVGSAICGAAPSINVLILGRAIAGMSGSGQYIGCMTLIAATTTMTERPMYVSLTGLSWGLGTVLGPVIGAAFAQSSVGWRWGFYINLFVGAACAPAWLFLIPSKDPRPGTPFRARAAEIDYAGITLQAGMLAALLLAVNLGGVTFPWDSGRIIALFVFTRTDGPLDAGVWLLPFIAVLIVFIIINGTLMSKLGYYMPWYLVGGCIVVIGSALMYTIDQDDSESRVYGYTVMMGAGTGMFAQAGYSVAQAVFVGITLSGLVQSFATDVQRRVLGAIISAIDKTYILVIVGGALAATLSLAMRREKLFGGAAAGIAGME